MTAEVLTNPDLDLTDHLESLDPSKHGKLGAHVGGGDPRIPLLRDLVRAGSSVQVPKAVHRSLYGYDYGMLGNDQYGDCVFAAIVHAIMHGRKCAGRDDVPADSEELTKCTLQGYSEVTGFNPNDPNTDQGTDPTQAWEWWQTTGVPLPDGSRDKIAGSVQILPHDGVNLRRAIFEFDGAGLSLAMPVAWQDAKVWDVGGDAQTDPNWQPGSWGGHEVYGVSFDATNIAVVTWGGIKLMTWRAWGTYGQLALAQVSQDLIGKSGVSETGLDYALLAADLPQL